MRIAICEDDQNILTQLVQDVREILGAEYKVFGYSSLRTLDLVRDRIEFDIHLLDIELEDGNGFEYAKGIRSTNSKCKIAFITAYHDYSVAGYTYDINGYLLKPIQYEELQSLLSRITVQLTTYPNPIRIIEYHQEVYVFLEDILTIERKGRKTKIITTNDIFEINESISSLMQRINHKCLYPLRRCLAVNVENITRIHKAVAIFVTLQSKSIEISTSEFKNLHEYRSKIYGGGQ